MEERGLPAGDGEGVGATSTSSSSSAPPSSTSGNAAKPPVGEVLREDAGDVRGLDAGVRGLVGAETYADAEGEVGDAVGEEDAEEYENPGEVGEGVPDDAEE